VRRESSRRCGRCLRSLIGTALHATRSRRLFARAYDATCAPIGEGCAESCSPRFRSVDVRWPQCGRSPVRGARMRSRRLLVLRAGPISRLEMHTVTASGRSLRACWLRGRRRSAGSRRLIQDRHARARGLPRIPREDPWESIAVSEDVLATRPARPSQAAQTVVFVGRDGKCGCGIGRADVVERPSLARSGGALLSVERDSDDRVRILSGARPGGHERHHRDAGEATGVLLAAGDAATEPASTSHRRLRLVHAVYVSGIGRLGVRATRMWLSESSCCLRSLHHASHSQRREWSRPPILSTANALCGTGPESGSVRVRLPPDRRFTCAASSNTGSRGRFLLRLGIGQSAARRLADGS